MTVERILNLDALNDKEKEALRKFRARHKKHGITADGGTFTFKVTPCSLGTIVIVECICGKEKNITDFSCW